MGLVINVDLETNQGPTNELFIRIDSWKINNSINEIKFSTTSWLNKSYGDRFLRKYYDDSLKPSIGLVTSKVVYYESPDSEGKDIEISNYYSVPMYKEELVTVDILEEKEITKEIPFVSFDEEGNEITVYKSVTSIEKVKVRTEEQIKKLIDYSIPLSKLGDFCYSFLTEELSKVFPKDKINKI